MSEILVVLKASRQIFVLANKIIALHEYASSNQEHEMMYRSRMLCTSSREYLWAVR